MRSRPLLAAMAASLLSTAASACNEGATGSDAPRSPPGDEAPPNDKAPPTETSREEPAKQPAPADERAGDPALAPAGQAPSDVVPAEEAKDDETQQVDDEAAPPKPEPQAPPAGPELWDSAYDRAIGPRPSYVEPDAPWPACATTYVRERLASEWFHREKEAKNAHQEVKNAWKQRRKPIAAAASAGFFVRPPPASALKRDADPTSVQILRDAFGEVGEVDCHVIDIVEDNSTHSADVRNAARALDTSLSGASGYYILCEHRRRDMKRSFVVHAPMHLVVARIDDRIPSEWELRTEGHFEPSLRSAMHLVARGDVLRISGIGRLKREPRNPGFPRHLWRGIGWLVDFERACPYKGLDCEYNDGHPEITITRTRGDSCELALGAHVDDMYEAWRRLGPKAASAQQLALWIHGFGTDSPAARKIEAENLRLAGDLDGAAAIFKAQKDAQALAMIAEQQLKKPPTVKAGLANLDAAIALERRPAWMLRGAGMALQIGETESAISRLGDLVTVTDDPRLLNQAADLLGFAGAAEAAAGAREKAAAKSKR